MRMKRRQKARLLTLIRLSKREKERKLVSRRKEPRLKRKICSIN